MALTISKAALLSFGLLAAAAAAAGTQKPAAPRPLAAALPDDLRNGSGGRAAAGNADTTPPSFTAVPEVSGPSIAAIAPIADVILHRTALAERFGPGHDAAHDREFAHVHRHDFRSHDVKSLDETEKARWVAGLWHRDWHYGRWGWWYDIGDVWYPYVAPVYPYPLDISEISVPETATVELPEGMAPLSGEAIAKLMPVTVSLTWPDGTVLFVRPLPAAPAVTYHCDPLEANYPAIRTCPAPWTEAAK